MGLPRQYPRPTDGGPGLIRVALCDDDRAILHGLTSTLGRDREIAVVAVVETGEDALLYAGQVDVWLMDVRLPGRSGVEVASVLRSRERPPKVLMMTSFDVGEVLNSIKVGVSGFVHKDAFLMNVAAAIKAVYAGYQVGNDVVMSAIARHLDRLAIVDPAKAARVARDDLDRQLLDLVMSNASIESMAEQAHLSSSGVHKRLKRMFERAGVKNQRALSAWLYGL